MNNWYYCRYLQSFYILPIKQNTQMSLKLEEKIILKSSKYQNNAVPKTNERTKSQRDFPFFKFRNIVNSS